ncbi:hypothetical protein FPL01_08020 [Bacillus pacificus]|uniref:Uncharacterized protein n=1 Tax=Bacillus pacificus TaxID=2026187 RepID=A0ABX6I486_9BACI|nr:hypothetical protein COM56_08760 [Bacillus cereus]QHH88727.1 hypothetical protein FPL01_08020 [Bacillus pacificus]RRB00556.1 hypothetical protein EH195_18090 [Bacillus pacificus]
MGSKTPTSKFSESKEARWGMKKSPLIKVSLYYRASLLVEITYIRQITTKKYIYFCYAMKVINL